MNAQRVVQVHDTVLIGALNHEGIGTVGILVIAASELVPGVTLLVAHGVQNAFSDIASAVGHDEGVDVRGSQDSIVRDDATVSLSLLGDAIGLGAQVGILAGSLQSHGCNPSVGRMVLTGDTSVGQGVVHVASLLHVEAHIEGVA